MAQAGVLRAADAVLDARVGVDPAPEDDLHLPRVADVDVVGAQRLEESTDVPRRSEEKPYWCSVHPNSLNAWPSSIWARAALM